MGVDPQRTFVCQICLELCEGENTLDEAIAQALAFYDDYGSVPREDRAMICGSCASGFFAWMTQTYGPPPWPAIPDETAP